MLIVDSKSGGPSKVVHLVAPSMQDKTAWISDISQVSFDLKSINYTLLTESLQAFQVLYL